MYFLGKNNLWVFSNQNINYFPCLQFLIWHWSQILIAFNFLLIFKDIRPICGVTTEHAWNSTTSVLGSKARLNFSFVCFITCMQCITRYGVTPADLLVASKAGEPLFIYLLPPENEVAGSQCFYRYLCVYLGQGISGPMSLMVVISGPMSFQIGRVSLVICFFRRVGRVSGSRVLRGCVSGVGYFAVN